MIKEDISIYHVRNCRFDAKPTRSRPSRLLMPTAFALYDERSIL